MAFDQGKYANEYTRENYDVVRALIPKGKNKDIKALAKARGISVSQLIVEALEAYYKLDLSRQSGG